FPLDSLMVRSSPTNPPLLSARALFSAPDFHFRISDFALLLILLRVECTSLRCTSDFRFRLRAHAFLLHAELPVSFQ
ncbi:Exocyst complex component 8, partial [Clarias magur]